MKQECKKDFLTKSLVVKRIEQRQLSEKNTGDKPDNEQLFPYNICSFIKIKQANARKCQQGT